jgi:hypothetical protein
VCEGRRAATDFVVEEDRAALRALWADAAARQRVAGGDACTGHERLRHLRADGGLLHVDVRACTDGQYIYKARRCWWRIRSTTNTASMP